MRGIAIAEKDPEYLVHHYLENSGKYVLSPNSFFNEKYYREKYPDVTTGIKQSKFSCGFEHFIKIGASTGLSPAWFFSGSFYAARYSDLGGNALRSRGFADAYSHYLKAGVGDGRGGMWLTAVLSQFGLSAGAPKSAADLLAMVRDPKRLTPWLSPLFDAEWFATKYGTSGRVDEDILAYLTAGDAARYSPCAAFDESYYAEAYPDVANAVQAGVFANCYEHFLLFGMHEGRRPLRIFDPDYYVAANKGAADECESEQITPFLHFLKYRHARALSLEPPYSEGAIPENSGKAIFERRALVVSRLSACALPRYKDPVVSIIIIARNKFPETFQCIQSIVTGTSIPFEIILYDNASTDEIAHIEHFVPGIRRIRSECNKGFTIPVNEAAELARGRYLLLVNNDTEIAPRAVDRVVEALEADSSIGVVGGRIIRTHGLLQEAGSIIWRDGTCLGYGRDLKPFDGCVDFARDVDYCSGCFLGISAADWRRLGGFDPAFAPAYYEETDLCIRVWQMGKRVVYDPQITLWHFEFGSSSLPEDAIALMRRNRNYFASKHRAYLSRCLPPNPQYIEQARLRHLARPRVLFIEDQVPSARLGMGFVRSSRIASILDEVSGHLTVVGLHPERDQRRPGDRNGWGPRTEVLPDVNHTNIASLLAARKGLYDYVWLSRTHNIAFLKQWRAEVPEFFEGVRIVVDTEAIAAARSRRQAELFDEAVDLDELLSVELDGIEAAGDVCVVSEEDFDLVQRDAERRGTFPVVHLLGHAIEPADELPAFDNSSGIHLIGSFANLAGPNVDAVRWFDAAVRPLLSESLANVPIIIAGYRAKEFVERGELYDTYEVMSDIADMSALYRHARIVVAPTRFAGGIPYKVHEAAAHGVPVVMSELLGRQLGWADDPSLAVVHGNAPERFARMIEALYRDSSAWISCRNAQLKRIRQDCNVAKFVRSIRNIVNEKQPAEVGRAEPKLLTDAHNGAEHKTLAGQKKYRYREKLRMSA